MLQVDSHFVGASIFRGEREDEAAAISSAAYNELMTSGLPFYTYKLLRAVWPLSIFLLLVAMQSALRRHARKLRHRVWAHNDQHAPPRLGSMLHPRSRRVLRGKIIGPVKRRHLYAAHGGRLYATFIPLTRPHWRVNAVRTHGHSRSSRISHDACHGMHRDSSCEPTTHALCCPAVFTGGRGRREGGALVRAAGEVEEASAKPA